jgi:general nucleoside transport system permease protein
MIRFIPILNPNRFRAAWVSLGAILCAAIVTGFLFAAYGSNPLEVYRIMISGTLFETQGLAEVARRTIPLLLIGVGLTLAFRAQFFNIGAEGQMLLGAIFAAIIPLFFPLGVLSIPVMLVMGAIGGGLGALLAALLRQRFAVNEILSTLMLNYVAYYLVLYLIAGPWKGKNVRGFIYTDEFPNFAQMPLIGGTLVHYPTLILGIIAAVALQILLSKTTLGFGNDYGWFSGNCWGCRSQRDSSPFARASPDFLGLRVYGNYCGLAGSRTSDFGTGDCAIYGDYFSWWGFT